MRRVRLYFIPLMILVLCMADSRHYGFSIRFSPVERQRVDILNKEAFLNRYQNPELSIRSAYRALDIIHQTMPSYFDGILRSYNNLAFGYYMLAQHDSAQVYIDSVIFLTGTLPAHNVAENSRVERVIARLMNVRLLQRSCFIADSYDSLYSIEHSRIFSHPPSNFLYSYAQMEYYITSLTLNYHYRNSSVASASGTELTAETIKNMLRILGEIEESRKHLRCDYDEDLALNYAIAHSYYRLASASDSTDLLRKSYRYLIRNCEILSYPNQFSIYHLANVFQLQAFIVADPTIRPKAYFEDCWPQVDSLRKMCATIYPRDRIAINDDYGFNMFRVSTDLFFQTSDPYQHLGAVVSAAEYCLRINRFSKAVGYYSLILADTTWHENMAPKFEAMLYDGIIRTGFSDFFDDKAKFYVREMELQNMIRQNESADASLRDKLEKTQSRTKYLLLAMTIVSIILLVFACLVVLLRHRTRSLRDETLALQEAKRQDVERIANVETCLSVMRHDVNPFLSYLQNKKLSPEMRQEVLEQLLRTFSNIKNWTNISIPSGLQFQPSQFSLAEVFDVVGSTCINVHDHVLLRFLPNRFVIWGDRQLTEMMLRNLVNNSLQHTSQGSVIIEAKPYSDDPRFAHITISDTGCGMNDEQIEELFRADKKIHNESGEAHGFGLILCKYIIKRHDDNTLRGCRIWAQSTPGKGTTMNILLALSGAELN